MKLSWKNDGPVFGFMAFLFAYMLWSDKVTFTDAIPIILFACAFSLSLKHWGK